MTTSEPEKKCAVCGHGLDAAGRCLGLSEQVPFSRRMHGLEDFPATETSFNRALRRGHAVVRQWWGGL